MKKRKVKLQKYSLKSQKEWVQTSPVFKKKTLYLKSYQVMQRWEDNYMKSLSAIATSHGGDILEVGYGLGISARYIQKSQKITSHTIIECHPEIYRVAKKQFTSQVKSVKPKIVLGFWEKITPDIKDEFYDGILFDTAPLDSGVQFFQFFPFFSEAYRLLKVGGVFTYFSDERNKISNKHLYELKKAGFKSTNIDYKICRVFPPKSCEYWKHNTIIVPIITK